MFLMSYLRHLLLYNLPQQMINVIFCKRYTGGLLTTHEAPHTLAYMLKSQQATRIPWQSQGTMR